MLEFLPEKDADYRTQQGSLPFCSLNQACFTDVAVILVDPGVKLEKPIQVKLCPNISVMPCRASRHQKWLAVPLGTYRT